MELQEALAEAFVASRSLPRAWQDASMGDQLRAMRLSQRVSQRHLSEDSGVAQSFISRMERGADALWAIWRRLFSALGIDVVLAPFPPTDDTQDFLQDGVRQRQERMEAGRLARWWPRR